MNTTNAGGRRTWWPFIVAAFTLVVLLMGTNVPTPLYPTYEKAFALTPLVIALIFAVYALVLIPSLLIFGPLSDAVGRRRVLLPAVGIAAVGAALFVPARGVGLLFAARAVQGLTLGAVQGTATAALNETDPDERAVRAALVASVATAGGVAAGPLMSGLLAEYAPVPGMLPYAVEVVLLGVAAAGLGWLFPRDAARNVSYRPRRPSVPVEMRRTFAMAGTSAALAWAVTGLFLALIPSYVVQVLRTSDVALIGVVAAVMLGSSAFAQLVLPRLRAVRAQLIGLSLLVLGLGGVVAAASTESVVVIVAAAVVAGLGQGLTFGGALREVNAVAPADHKADVLSSFYVVIYLGVSVPTIGVGLLSLGLGLLAAVRVFAVVVAVGCLVGAFLHRRLRHRDTPAPRERVDAVRHRPGTGRAS